MKLLVLLLFCCLIGGTAERSGGRISRIVDGDTVYIEGYNQSFRLIGIDCPESTPNARAKSIAERTGASLESILAQGKAAKVFTQSLMLGKMATIEWDVQRQDRYGRNLAYLWIGGVNASVEIARAGHANQLTIPPNVKYAQQILVAVQQARSARRGIWR